jgi:predicted ATPase
VADVNVPDTLQGVIMERIDSLEETTKRVLQQSAVIGNVFQERVLENITDVERQIDDYLDRLEHQEFVFAQAGGAEPEYIFKHLLSHEVAYSSLLIARRRMFHRRIGRYLEARYAERLDGYMNTLADHFYRGGEWLKAMDYAQRAGRRAKALFANAEALQYFSRMLEIAERLESGKTDLLEDEPPISSSVIGLTPTWIAATCAR